MKIAIIGTNRERVEETVRKAMSEWSIYQTPIQTIWNIQYPEDENELPEAFREWVRENNDAEKRLLHRLNLLIEQDEKYKEMGYVFYNGSGIDLICEGVIGYENGEIAEEVVDKLIYYNKKLMRNLDAIFWIPEEMEENHENPELEKLETAYGNLWMDYQNNLAASPFFEANNVPGFLRVDETNPIMYMKYVINSRGNLANDKDDLVDMGQMERLFKKAPELLEALKKGTSGEDIVLK